MAEAILLSSVYKMLGVFWFRLFKAAFEEAIGVKEELDKLKQMIEFIQVIAADVEKSADESAAVKNWVKRIKEVLYDAEDLFDEVATNDLLWQQITEENKFIEKVRALIPTASVPRRAKAIRERLLGIEKLVSSVMSFQCLERRRGLRERAETRPFSDEKLVIGSEIGHHITNERSMDETPLFSLSSRLLYVMSTRAFKAAYQRVQSFWGAKEDLDKLKRVIQLIQDVLFDAENKQDDSPVVKVWVRGVADLLHQVDSLVNEIVPNEAMLIQNQTMEKNQLKVVSFFISSVLNPFVPCSHTFTKRVKVLTERLVDICKIAVTFEQRNSHDHPRAIGCSDPRQVFGRDDDKTSIIELLLDKSNGEKRVVAIAVVGIGGMGKTTLAQLILDEKEVQTNFKNRWWACLSNATGVRQVCLKILESITECEDFGLDSLDLGQIVGEITKSLRSSGDYLLILDDVWNDLDPYDWNLIMTVLSAARGKVIVTTMFLWVPRAMEIDRRQVYTLNGLSDDNSWELFKSIAFTKEQVNDPNWLCLGREIAKKCVNVPLVLRSVASLLSTKDTIQDWESIRNENLLTTNPSVSSVLKLSYNQLPSKVMQCFDYCSLFPKDHLILKEQLIDLWVAQGYVQCGGQSTLEEAGDRYFMRLVDICFFKEIKVDNQGEIISCKMNDLFHELAQQVAGVETIMLPRGSDQLSENSRHLSVDCEIDDSRNILPPLIEANKLRSFFMFGKSCSSVALDQQVMKLRFLRALDLHALNIDEVPSSIGQLKYLRYLNLSQNAFPDLPDSITMLVNLLTLDISSCRHLQSLPGDFRKLITLRHLDISYCDNLWYMPPGFGELTSLVHLSDFKVSKHGGGNSKSSGLDALAQLNLTGKLAVTYDRKGAWGREELMLKRNHIPETVKVLSISDYPSMELPCLWKEAGNAVTSKLEHLVLIRCGKLKHLPPLQCLPLLESLRLYHLQELEYIDDSNVGSTTVFFPALQKLEMVDLPKLKYWSRGTEEARARNDEHIVGICEQQLFCSLLNLEIKSCYSLEYMPPCPHLETLCLEETRKELVTQLLPTCSFTSPHSSAPSSSLQEITVNWCNELTSFPGESLTNLRKLDIRNCTSLKILKLASYDLKEITISNSPVMELWCCREGEQSGVDCHFLKKLRLLNLDEIPEVETLPGWLQQIIGHGKLKIKEW